MVLDNLSQHFHVDVKKEQREHRTNGTPQRSGHVLELSSSDLYSAILILPLIDL